MELYFKKLQDKFSFSDEFLEQLKNAYEECKDYWENANEIASLNQLKILEAFQNNKTSDFHLNGSTGYGYGDVGRDLLEDIWANIFKAEKALVRSQIASGTHAIALALFGNLKPGDEFVSISGSPYDTLHQIIGKDKNDRGTLTELGISHKIVDLKDDYSFDIEAIANAITDKTKMICIQRSRGYSWRPSLCIENIRSVIQEIKQINSDIICFVDNCYGEFIELKEPLEVGADLIAGSLIKNPGGGISPRGGYVAGRKDLVENAALRLTAPGISEDVGSSLDFNRPTYQGLFMAPLIVSEALKGAIFAAKILEEEGYAVSPKFNEKRTDIIQAIKVKDPEKMRKFSVGIQKASPLDSYVTPCESALPGYDNAVIMAGGTFIQGSSIELSIDGPFREPYIIYLQGGLTHYHVILGVVSALNEINSVKER